MIESERQEVLDLVDSNDAIIGTIKRGEMMEYKYKHPKGHVRFVSAFIVNKDGNIWTQIRSMHKFIAPGGLDYSVGEHVLSGETYQVAMLRGFKEEVGMTVHEDRLTFLGALPPTEEKPVFDAVYALMNYDGPEPPLNKEEFSSSRWLTIPEMREILRIHPSKTSLLPALDLLEQHIEEHTKI